MQKSSHIPEIIELLKLLRLPVDDIQDGKQQFICSFEKEQLVRVLMRGLTEKVERVVS